MSCRWLLVLPMVVVASALPALASSNGSLSVHVKYAIMGIEPSAVTLSCGAFAAGAPPKMGSTPLTHVWRNATKKNGMAAMAVPIPASARYVACWPSTSATTGLNEKMTTRMVWDRYPIPLPSGPILMPAISVMGNAK